VRLLAEVLTWRGRHDDSLALLETGPPDAAGATERSRWLITQATSLYWARRSPPQPPWPGEWLP
jgi:hypothetical protein